MKIRIDTVLNRMLFASLMFLFTMQLFGQIAQTPLPGRSIPKYVDAMPHFVGTRVDGTKPITITMEEFEQNVLPSTFVYPASFTGTTVWGYQIDGTDLATGTAKTFGPLYPTYTIEAQRGTPTTVHYVNNLTNPFLQQYLVVDQTLHWANPLELPMGDPDRMNPYGGPVPAVVHLHGGEVPSAYDGGPDSWFTPGLAQTGLGFVSDTYTYPNTQEASTIWFHDHTLGATRLNVYAGLAGFYLIRDGRDNGLTSNPIGLPAGEQEIEIVIQDRMFDTNGQLYFPSIGINPEHPFWIPEFLGDVIVVNGETWPYLNVEPRRYRFRMLNGSNARFYNLTLTDILTLTPGPAFWQIGTDGGFLDTPVQIAFPNRLLMAPGERADVIVDFSAFAGKTLLMENNARAPYPNGTPPDPQTTKQIMQIRVGTTVTGGTDNSTPPANLALRTSPIVPLVNFAAATPAVTPDVRRQLTLNEVMGPGGPLEVLVNNSKWDGTNPDGPIPGSVSDGRGNYVTEVPQVGSTEMWQIINLTADAHPIHLHLVQFQLVSRQRFQTNKYVKAYETSFPGGAFIPSYGPPLDYLTGTPGILGGNPDVTPYLRGRAQPAELNERGWKDTFIMYPGEVTTVMVRYAPTDEPTSTPGVNTYAFDPTSGPGYVWHCHIIDHEDNEMMRPYLVSNSSQIAARQTIAEAENGILENAAPRTFALDQNYPNPFNPTTLIRFQIPEGSNVNLKIYNSLGQEIRTLASQFYESGEYQTVWDAKDNSGNKVPSGVYFYRINAGNYSQIKKMMLIR